ncbi:MAG: hypothetical protein ACK4UW_01940 [Rhizobium rhizophilum]|uniref:hypothetical protein n=1 Tax=Rhizobium rhizophilum TaxID=1850373 RepID=UPI0039196B5D
MAAAFIFFNLRQGLKPVKSRLFEWLVTPGLPPRGRLILSVWQVSHGDHGFLTQLIFFRPHQGTIFLFEASCCGVRREKFRTGGNKCAGWV